MRDTFLWRLCAKECAWIDCDTKYEWISNMKITKEQLKQIIVEELRDYYGGESHSQSERDAAQPRKFTNLERDMAKEKLENSVKELFDRKVQPEKMGLVVMGLINTALGSENNVEGLRRLQDEIDEMIELYTY
jgi:hypothetical protein